jgi:hypothetical protein
MLDIILQRVRDHSPHLLEPEGRLPEAAVLMPITRSEDPELVLTLRASGLSTVIWFTPRCVRPKRK